MSWMEQALSQAARVQGTTSPNPAVGAVLIADGVVIGAGGTHPVGGLHAETAALLDCRSRGHDPRGSTLYVTLEPCCHHGRQPPCTDAVIEAGVGQVVIGVLDPNPAMCGRSVDLLRHAGIDVVIGDQGAACARSVLGFARAITRGLPEVTVKTAASADGSIATAGGESQWITGEEARAQGQQLRASHDAILVGINTVLHDDPRLTCRLPDCTSPVAVVLDTHLRFPAGCNLDHPGTLVFCGPAAPERKLHAQVIRVGLRGDRVDVDAALRELVRRGHHRVLVEGGGEVIASFLAAQRVDTLHQFVAGRLIPGGRRFVGGVASGLDEHPMQLLSHDRVGVDLHLVWALEHGESALWASEDACSLA